MIRDTTRCLPNTYIEPAAKATLGPYCGGIGSFRMGGESFYPPTKIKITSVKLHTSREWAGEGNKKRRIKPNLEEVKKNKPGHKGGKPSLGALMIVIALLSNS